MWDALPVGSPATMGDLLHLHLLNKQQQQQQEVGLTLLIKQQRK